VDPILYDTGYNPINTLTWAILLIIFVLLLFKLLKRLGIVIDETFVFANIPYVVVGGLLRVVEDAELISPPLKYFLITPLIYFVIFFVAIAVLVVSVMIRNSYGIRYERVYGGFGLLWMFSLMVVLSWNLDIRETLVLPFTFFVAGGITVLFFLFFRKVYTPLSFKVNLAVIFAHMTDASATFIGIDFFNYWEKHVLPSFFINLTGTAAVMYILKFVVFIPLLYFLDKELETERELANFLKFVLITIGLAPGIRDAVRIAMGV